MNSGSWVSKAGGKTTMLVDRLPGGPMGVLGLDDPGRQVDERGVAAGQLAVGKALAAASSGGETGPDDRRTPTPDLRVRHR